MSTGQIRRGFVALVVAFASLGVPTPCAAGPPRVSAVADWQEYYPLATGNSWTYKVWEEGKEPSTVEWRVEQVIKEASGDVFVIWPSPPIDDESIMLLSTKDGLREWDFGDSLGFYVLKAPINQADSWHEEFYSNTRKGNVTRVARVLSVGKPCRSGEYEFSDCVMVQEDNEDLSLKVVTAYARNVGRVKVEYFRLRPGRGAEKPFAILTLVSYRLSATKGAPTNK